MTAHGQTISMTFVVHRSDTKLMHTFRYSEHEVEGLRPQDVVDTMMSLPGVVAVTVKIEMKYTRD